MARNIEDLFVRLKLEGFENLDKIKGSFRELNKVTGFTETEVSNLRKEVLEFGKAAGNTEAVTKGVISVLQGLRTQADLCGNAYAQLTNDLKRLNEAARGSTDTLEKQRQALLNNADAGRQNVDSLQRQINALKQLQRETRPGSSAFIQLGKDIDAVTVKLGKLKSEAQAFNLALNQQAGATPSVLNNQIALLQRGLQNVRYDAEQFVNTLRQIQLLQITQSGRTGRAGVIASFEAYRSREYLRGFADPSRLPEMPDTLAAIRLRISEINSELENITGYRRRRDLTLELKDLNRQLKNSVLDVTSQEDLALQRLRARVAAQRELNRASGFLAFSRKVSGGEYDPAITRSVEKARRSRGLFSPEQQAVINETTAQLERSSIDASNAVREATTRNVQLEIRALQLKNEEADRLNAELIASNQRVADAEVATFDRLLAARDRYATSKGFAKQYLGLSGQELSPFYQQVVELGIGAAGTQASKYQKRDFKRVLTDTIDAFNLQLTESGRTAVEGMGYFKEAAIAHAGGSEKVRRVLDRWDKDAIPANMFPLAGEQGDAYRRRIEEGSNLFKQVIDAFRNTLNRSGKTLSTSADQIRDSAVSFAAQAGRGKEVSTALGRFGAAGNIPMFMLPGTGENPETYATRITGAAPVQIPQLGDVRQSSLRKLLEMQQLLQEIRNDVPPIGKEFANLDRQISQSINKIDREIGRRQGTGRLSGMQLAQGVGAALSGGIFGGPEGLIGGLGGLAVGGVGGAFAGAAFGAQVGMLRQSAYSAGEYAASVDRLNIALQGVVKSTDAYAAAQQTIRSAQVQLNLPILEGTQGFTQLSASVIAAGGNVTDASTVFRGVTEAIKATGGGAEQVQAALLAMSQIFSKGKVSAEELQGQLGERLPGAVALFAAATNRSLPQLQKDLKDGVVGLNDVMKFASKLSETYGTQAAAMAASSADSTARMQASLKDLQYSFGSIVKPISSSVQDVISKMADMANATLKAVGVVKTGLSELGAVDRAKDLSRRAGYAYTALGVGPQSYSEKKTAFALAEQLANAATPQRSAVGVKQNIAALQQALEVIKRIDKQELSNKQIDLLFKYGTALDKRVEKERTLLRVLESKVKVTTFKGVGQDSSTKEQTAADKAADKAAKEAQAAAVEQQRLATDLREQQLRVADTVFQHQIELDRQRYELQKRLDDAQAQNRILRETGISRTIVTNFENLQRSLREIEERRVSAQQRVAAAEQIQRTAAARASFAAEGAMRLGAGVTSRGLPSGISGYITGDPRSPFYRADHGGSNYHEHLSFISRAAAEAAYKTLTGAGIKVTEFKGYGRVGRHSEGSAHYRGLAFDVPAAQVAVGAERALTARVQALLGFGVGRLPKGVASQQSRALKTAGAASIEALDTAQARRELLLTEQTAQKEREQAFASFVLNATDSLREQNAALEESNKLQALRNRLSLEGVSPERINLEERLLSLRIQQGKSEETYTKLKAQYPESASQLTDAYKAQTAALQEQVRLLRESADAQESYNKATRGRQDMRVGKGIREGAQAYVDSLGTMREATSQLAQTGIKGVEDALFSLVTTGTANFREFAASILKDTARMIIQQMILRQVLQLFGPISSSSTAANFEMPGAAFIPKGGFKLNALGAAYAANGIQPFARGGAFSHGVTAYAMGGVVKRPTMFAFANGGAGRLGLMGEAGPEAIMPLRRLPSGRLGVESAGGGGMNVVVNVDASGSQVQGNSADASQLGKVLSAAVQQELINQQRPGGLLAPKR